MVYRIAFVTGLAILLLATGLGFYQSIRVERRLPPLALYSAIGGSLEDLAAEGGAEHRIDELRLMLRLMPAQAKATHNALGRALEERGELEEAVEHYRQALALDPRFAEAHENLGIALAKQGRLAEAIAETREALRLDPELGAARENLSRMEARLAGQGQAAGTGSTPPEVERGRDFAQQFYRGEVEELHTHFAEAFAAQMPLGDFIELRRTMARQLGAETELLEERIESSGASKLYVRRARFEKHAGAVEVVIQLTGDDSILGFMIRPAS